MATPTLHVDTTPILAEVQQGLNAESQAFDVWPTYEGCINPSVPANACPCGGEFVPSDGLLTWTAVDGATGYEIQVYSGVMCEGVPILDVTI